MKLTEIFPAGVPPAITAKELKFGDVVFICPVTTCFDRESTGVGVYLGETARGAQIFVWGVAEWRRYEANELVGKELRVRTIWKSFRLSRLAQDSEDREEFFRYLYLGTSKSFVLPDGYELEQINPINK